MVKSLCAFVFGAYAAFLNFIGSGYLDTALEGLIGGLTGYLGPSLMTWIIKEVKKQKQQKQDKTNETN